MLEFAEMSASIQDFLEATQNYPSHAFSLPNVNRRLEASAKSFPPRVLQSLSIQNVQLTNRPSVKARSSLVERKIAKILG